MHLPDFLHRNARRVGHVEAVRDAARSRTFAELEDRAARLAAGLTALGVAPGDRVAVLASNRVEVVELYFACAMLGCVLVPLNGRLRGVEVAFQVEDAEARAVVVETRHRELFEEAEVATEGLHRVALIDEGDEPPAGWIDLEALLAREPLPRREPTPDAVVAQMYTSGTTGRPKGATLTHRNVFAMTLAWLHEIGLKEAPDRFLLVMPLFHVGGLLHTMASVAAGAHLLLVHEFLPGAMLDTLARERVTHVLFVPAMIQWLLQEKGVEARAFPDLRRIVYGGSPIPAPTLARALEVFDCELVQGYGLTETSGVVTVLRPEDHAREELRTSAGRAVLTCEVRVVDEDGREVERGAVGEVVARGEQVTPGYWKRPDATAEALRGGWFHTGDLGRMDAEGYVTIVDRLKDMILVAGENVYPSEVEAVLARHAGVIECTVIGVPHETWGEEVLAFVVAREGKALAPTELVAHCRASLARFKCPTRVELVDALPRNAGGKVLKRELRAPFWAGRERSV